MYTFQNCAYQPLQLILAFLLVALVLAIVVMVCNAIACYLWHDDEICRRRRAYIKSLIRQEDEEHERAFLSDKKPGL